MNDTKTELHAPTDSKSPEKISNNGQRATRKNQGNPTQNNDPKKSRKMTNKPQQQMAKDDPNAQIFQFMQEQVRNRLEKCEPGRELEVLHSSLKPDHHTLWLKCMEVKKDLLLALQRQYPGVRLEVFGSTVMGIAFKDSDFDFFIELSRPPLNAKPAEIIGRAMNILRRSGQFTNFLPISHARVPILKCYHTKTSMAVDINFSDSYGILNSPIVARLLTFDTQIYVLATILKYWAKVHDCAGKNRISNYAIVWMLLFYLQQLPVPILPPIIEFQKRVHPLFVNGYNFAFDEFYPNQTKNQSRCSELLMGFFKFYKSFDFDKNVICPLYGKSFKKADILAQELTEFQRYHEMLKFNPTLTPMQFNKCICIQDPFETTHTIPGAIAAKEFQKIITKFEYAANIIESELEAGGESTKLLLSIFDAGKFLEYVRRKNQKVPEPRVPPQLAVLKPQSTTNRKIVLQIKPTDYHLSIIRDILMKKHSDTNVKIDNQTIHRSWAENIIQSIHGILQDIFMLKVENMTSQTATNGTNTPSTSATPEPQTDTTSDDSKSKKIDEFSKEFSIVGTRDVFLARKQTKKITVNTLNYERLESQERFKKNALQLQLSATVHVTTDVDNFELITVEFNDLIKTKKNNSFRNFITNFEQNLNNLLKVYLVHKCGTAA
ncbi:UTP:RNA uridylyltransferase 1 isoform X2 [Contarinia nasturtii]|uniref:UTP:RNA uridylyltransferase 1 isoform X2 n=1 Tax=Contarinia nasturtii TaxID=265458 RepID=UPI0012D37FFD|nr:UTP:RNA uridylyltransferase 1 isoform X2 [Contarinia nasturtii]